MATDATMLLLSDLLSSHPAHVPSKYIRPESDRPDLFIAETSNATIRAVDLQGLAGADRSQVVEEIGLACKNDGFFLVVLYLSVNLLHDMMHYIYHSSHDGRLYIDMSYAVHVMCWCTAIERVMDGAHDAFNAPSILLMLSLFFLSTMEFVG